MRNFRKWMKTREVIDHENYKESARAAERIKNQAKKASWIKIGQDLENDLQGTRKLIYSTARNYRNASQPPTYAIKNASGTNLLCEPQEIELRWKAYFESLLNYTHENEHNIEIDFPVEDSEEP